ncbi:MAG: rRNA maturation RNase YbeY [Candidatus Promineifilaceae bacterium]|nr:rRNA maturation RNase YbeY [Candidatus Promineifilaceae bacterium]
MTYNLEILTDITISDEILTALDRAVVASLQVLAVPPSSLSLLLTNDERMRQLNLDYRQDDSSTDVLSFIADFELPDVEQLYLGDIAISVPYARNQAQARGHPLVAEMQLLAVHGVLHLLGYDHMARDERREMFSLQEKILSVLDLPHIAPMT